MKQRIKAWAVIAGEGELQMWGNRNLLVYDTLATARKAKIDAYGKGGTNARVIRCTLTYETPTEEKHD